MTAQEAPALRLTPGPIRESPRFKRAGLTLNCMTGLANIQMHILGVRVSGWTLDDYHNESYTG